jgi:hypothetical protein
MTDIDDAARLDRMIEDRRGGRGDSDGPADASLRAVADLAAELDELGRHAPALDEDVVWARVGAGVDAAPRVARRERAPWWTAPWWTLHLPRWADRPLWAAASAGAAVLLIVAFTLISQPRSTSAAFVEDVNELSSVAQAALADNQLTEDEKGNVAALAAALVQAIDENPAALNELAPEQREHVLGTLSDVMSRLRPISDDELLADDEAIVDDASSESTQLAATEDGDDGDGDAENAQDNGGPPEHAAQPVRPTPGGGSRQGLTVVAPSVTVSVTAIREVTDAVEHSNSGGGELRPSGATPGDLAGLCQGLSGRDRSECNRAVNSAVAACSGSSGKKLASGRCGEAASSAVAVCGDLLSEAAADTCEQAFAALQLEAASNAGAASDDDSEDDKGRGRGNSRGRQGSDDSDNDD